MPSTTSPTNWPIRTFISGAALVMKVMARISGGRARPSLSIWAIRVVSTGLAGRVRELVKRQKVLDFRHAGYAAT
jgi:hypothetical protein